VALEGQRRRAAILPVLVRYESSGADVGTSDMSLGRSARIWWPPLSGTLAPQTGGQSESWTKRGRSGAENRGWPSTCPASTELVGVGWSAGLPEVPEPKPSATKLVSSAASELKLTSPSSDPTADTPFVRTKRNYRPIT
jgi:hypothetical protein